MIPKHRKPACARSIAVEKTQPKLRSGSFPRAQTLPIVLLAGGCGLRASFVLLLLGMHSMAVRHPLALGIAYLCFLFFMWLWLRGNGRDGFDVGDFAGARTGRSGAGGDFAGLAHTPRPRGGNAVSDARFGSSSDAAGAVADVEGWAIPFLAIAFALGLALASVYVVAILPVLFAELLVNGTLSYALFRCLRGQHPAHWLAGALPRTELPFVIAAVFLAGTGAALETCVPGVHSVGQFVKEV